MHRNMWLRSGSLRECGATKHANKKRFTAQGIHKKWASPKGHHFQQQKVSSAEESPSWEQESCNQEEKEESKQKKST